MWSSGGSQQIFGKGLKSIMDYKMVIPFYYYGVPIILLAQITAKY